MALFPTARPNLNRVRVYEPGKPVEELEREYGVRNAVKMASNENALGPSPRALRALRKVLGGVHRYPDGGCYYLRRRLSRFLKVRPDWLIFGNGSDEVLTFAVRAFVDRGHEVVIADPTFLVYEIATTAQNGRVIRVPMRDFRYDLPAMARRVSARTRLVFIANPDNPVGTYVTERALADFLRKIPRRVIVVLDEAYFEFAREKKGYPDGLKLLRRFPNLLVTRTFSKAYGLSGLRIGYGAGRPDVIRALNKVREPFNVNLPAQAAALAALDDRAHLERTLRMTRSGRKYFYREFRALGLDFVDTSTNFVLVDLKRDARKIYRKLLRRGVIVRAMNAWGLETYLRVTIGRPKDNRRLIKNLKEFL